MKLSNMIDTLTWDTLQQPFADCVRTSSTSPNAHGWSCWAWRKYRHLLLLACFRQELWHHQKWCMQFLLLSNSSSWFALSQLVGFFLQPCNDFPTASPDLLASGSRDGSFAIWDLRCKTTTGSLNAETYTTWVGRSFFFSHLIKGNVFLILIKHFS